MRGRLAPVLRYKCGGRLKGSIQVHCTVCPKSAVCGWLIVSVLWGDGPYDWHPSYDMQAPSQGVQSRSTARLVRRVPSGSTGLGSCGPTIHRLSHRVKMACRRTGDTRGRALGGRGTPVTAHRRTGDTRDRGRNDEERTRRYHSFAPGMACPQIISGRGTPVTAHRRTGDTRDRGRDDEERTRRYCSSAPRMADPQIVSGRGTPVAAYRR